ncbi:MAG: ABC transporter permease [Anaerolineaceae bacterium]|nr:ABC transporter permease [Anaerolineaceae bacterium]
MGRLKTIVKKEFLHIFRDPRTMALIVLLPAVLLILLGYGVSGESEDISLAVADLSRSEESRRYIEYYTAGNDFSYTYSVLSEDELLELINEEKVKAGLLIPENFGRSVATNEPVQVQMYINGSVEPGTAQTVQLKLNAISQAAAQSILLKKIQLSKEGVNFHLPIDAKMKILYNPNGDGKLYMIPGLIPIILQVQTLLLSALSIVKEREQGTMEQLIVTPIKSWELMLGKIIPYLVVTLFNTLMLIWMGGWIFGVEVIGSYWQLVGLSMIFSLGSLGMGVLISNLSESQMQAMYLAVFIVIIPAIILSGLMLPRDGMPAFTYWFGEFMPVTHFLEITRGIMLKGVNASVLWDSIWPMIALSIVYFSASVVSFRKKL